MARWIEFEPVDWARVEADWRAWWAGELERPLVTIVTRDPGTFPESGDDFLSRFGLEQPADQIVDYFERQFQKIHYYGDACPKWWINFGAGIMAAFLGSAVEYRTGTTWFHPLPVASMAEIQPVYDPQNRWWHRVQEITCAAASRWSSRVVVGYTDLGGNLDILASLRGTEISYWTASNPPPKWTGLPGRLRRSGCVISMNSRRCCRRRSMAARPGHLPGHPRAATCCKAISAT